MDPRTENQDVVTHAPSPAPNAGTTGREPTNDRHSGRRGWVLAGIAAAAVALLSIGLAVAGTGDGPDRGTASDPDAAQPGGDAGGEPVPDGWRTESWHELELAVPADWGYGHLHQTGCQEDPPPAVERPGGISTAMWCPTIGYGVAIGTPGEVPYAEVREAGTTDGEDRQYFPSGATVERAEVAGIPIVVVAPDAETARRVVASAHEIEGEDANGCPPTATMGGIGTGDAGAGLGALTGSDAPVVGAVSLCRYAPAADEPAADEWRVDLVGSELLTEDESDALVRAVLDAPAGTGPDAGPEDCLDWPEDEVVVGRHEGTDLFRIHFTGCRGHGIDLLAGPDRTHQLTAEVMHWALMPGWSGGTIGEIPRQDGPARG